MGPPFELSTIEIESIILTPSSSELAANSFGPLHIILVVIAALLLLLVCAVVAVLMQRRKRRSEGPVRAARRAVEMSDDPSHPKAVVVNANQDKTGNDCV